MSDGIKLILNNNHFKIDNIFYYQTQKTIIFNKMAPKNITLTFTYLGENLMTSMKKYQNF